LVQPMPPEVGAQSEADTVGMAAVRPAERCRKDTPMPATGTINVFFSYAHADEALRDELEKHLALLKQQGLIAEWHDRSIGAGQEWAGAIDAHMDAADVILLLVSADFLHSDYCYGVEVERALQRHQLGEARVIPIILRPVDWHSAPFGRLQALPK